MEGQIMRNLTVKDFLSLKPAAEIRLVAGAKGQERVIHQCQYYGQPRYGQMVIGRGITLDHRFCLCG